MCSRKYARDEEFSLQRVALFSLFPSATRDDDVFYYYVSLLCLLTYIVPSLSLSLSRLRQQQFTAAAPVAASKIRIRLKSFETTHMQAACDKIIEAATATEARIKGPIPLPTKRRIYCVLRSPHVNKDSREHFETRTHNRVIDVYEPTAQTIDALMGLELPAGVDIRVKL